MGRLSIHDAYGQGRSVGAIARIHSLLGHCTAVHSEKLVCRVPEGKYILY